MNKDIFIGIENELMSFDSDNYRASFVPYFKDLVKHLTKNNIQVYNKGDQSIRTSEGLAYYLDGHELEMCTPPIFLNKGFATRLTNSLGIARDNVVRATPKLTHTGFSTHWNVSNHFDELFAMDNYNALSPIHALFGTTPLSTGIALRQKGSNNTRSDSSKRMEVLTDHIDNLDQVNAHALLFGSFVLSHYFQGIDFPKLKSFNFKPTTDFINGRYTRLKLQDGTKITAQDYLEAMYSYLEPIIQRVGTEEEIKNLNDFIQKNKLLEFDKFKYYSVLNQLELKEQGAYKTSIPELQYYTSRHTGQNLQELPKKPELPLEGKLLGYYVDLAHSDDHTISQMKWNYIDYRDHRGKHSVEGTADIYEHAAYKLGTTIEGTFTSLVPRRIVESIENSKIKYNEEEDSSAHSELEGIKLKQKLRIPRLVKTIGGIGLLLLTGYAVGTGIDQLFNSNQFAKKEYKAYQKLYLKNKATEQSDSETYTIQYIIDSTNAEKLYRELEAKAYE